MKSKIPQPDPNERPTSYADRLGRWYTTRVSSQHKKEHGQYLTPVPVAEYMARLFQPQGNVVRLLDPGAGAGVLTCAVGEHLAATEGRPTQLHAHLYETDHDLAEILRESLQYLKKWLSSRGLLFESVVETDDFVMAYSEELAEALGNDRRLFKMEDRPVSFDLVISNPPYFKIPKSDPRARAASTVIHGQPNIYALFMAASASVLKPGGFLVFITPRSYVSGPYFKRFRECFFTIMKPELIHVFESRTDAFKRDDILQENAILKACRQDGWAAKAIESHVRISASKGFDDLNDSRPESLRADLVLDMASEDKVLHIPTSDAQLAVMEVVRSWNGSLRGYGLEISTGPIVPFRAVPLLDEEGEVPGTHAPLLWMQHVTAMRIQWPLPEKKKPQYVKVSDPAMKLLVPNRNYVLIRRFSAKEEKRRLVAAPLLKEDLITPWVGLENHLNYIHRPGGELTEEEALGLAVLYNSSLLDTYFRSLNGNTQVSATELRAMPLPDKETIISLGLKAKVLTDPTERIDALLEDCLHRGKPSGTKETTGSVAKVPGKRIREMRISG